MFARTAGTIVLLLTYSTSLFALDPVYENFLGKAIKGYDPVAYFTEQRAVEGDSDFTHEWNGSTWYFASAENQKTFSDNPEQFAPQYGGYCAWAVSRGYTASIDPEAWYIHNDKLYLNYSKSVQKTWQQDVPGNIIKGDAEWPKLLKR